MELKMKNLLIPISTILLHTSCGYIESQLGFQEDNFGEELIEEMIELKFQVPVDLTPSSKE